MDFGLKNRRALVMGGTKGLGRSIADALAEEGAAVTISGRDQGRLDEAAAALSNTLRASIWAWLKTLSGEVAQDGVTMNVLAPGTILTDRTKDSAVATARRRNIGFEEALAERLAEASAQIPAGRVGMPDEYG